MICDLLKTIADQHMGPTFTRRAVDPDLHQITGYPAGYLHLDDETVEAANCRNG
jgi:hypothetical protein